MKAISLDPGMPHEGFETLAVVHGHVHAARVVVAQVQDDRVATLLADALEPLGCRVHLGLGDVAPAGEVRHAVFVADRLDHAGQGVLLDPDFDMATLVAPNIFSILLGDNTEDRLRADPRRGLLEVPGAVLNRIPIDQPGLSPVVDNTPKPLVLSLLIRDYVPSNELVVGLTQGQLEALCLVLPDDVVRLLNDGERVGSEVDFDECFFHGSAPRHIENSECDQASVRSAAEHGDRDVDDPVVGSCVDHDHRSE